MHLTQTEALNNPTVKDVIAILKTYPKDAEFLTADGRPPVQITLDVSASKVFFGDFKDIKIK